MTNQFNNLLKFLHRLDRSDIHYSVAYYRYDGISVQVSVPGERWEIDFLEDGTVDVERFCSAGGVHDQSSLEQLFERFAEADTAAPPDETVPHDYATVENEVIEKVKDIVEQQQ